MPQLMPLYWIMSTIIIILLLMSMMKIYGNYMFNNNFMDIKNVVENKKEMWYW